MTTPAGTHLELRSERYAMIENAAINAWVGGQPCTQQAILTAIEQDVGETISSGTANYHLAQLAKRGMYVSQPSRPGAKGRPGESPYIVNFGGLRIEGATLRDVVKPFLADSGVAATRKHALRSALRFYLSLSEQCNESLIITACERVPAKDLYGLPRRVRELAMSGTLKSKTARNHASAVAQAMRYAAERRLVPIIFPQYAESDPWTEALERYWPLTTEGESLKLTLSRRRGWRAFAEIAREVLGAERTPDSITREEAESLLREMTVRGQISVMYNVAAMLRDLGTRYRKGPFSGPSALDPFLVSTKTGARSAIMLRGGGPGWDGLLAALREAGVPLETLDYLEWYGVYITMPAKELLTRRDRFPHRRIAHRLGTSALSGRAQSLRAYFGAALYELLIPPGELTPSYVFGHQFDRIAGALITWWDRRRMVLDEGAVGSAQAGSLEKYIIGAGMVAYTLYEKLRFERRLKVAQRKSRSGKSTMIDEYAEEGATKTPDEQALWDASRTASGMAETLKAAVMEEKGVNNKGNVPEMRDIHRILANTGPEWWVALLHGLIDEFRKAKRNGRDRGIEYHRLVQTAYEVGWYISTGCRNEEGSIVRLDLHYRPALSAERSVAFTGRDRKNLAQTRVKVHADYVPDDLRLEYETRTRSFFMRDNHVAHGRKPVDNHPFLFVNEKGLPYGYRYEEMDAAIAAVEVTKKPGESDNQLELRLLLERRRVRESFETRFRQRAGQHGQRLKRAMARYAVKYKLKLSGRRYEFGLHTLRIACGYAIYLLRGIGAAAAYLGDTEATVSESYSAINGINVDSRCLLTAAVAAQQEHERRLNGNKEDVVGSSSLRDIELSSSKLPLANSPASVHNFAERLEKLLEAKRAGDIDVQEFARAKADLRR